MNEFVRALGIEGVTIRRGVEDNAAFRLGMNNSATARGLTQTMDLIARKKVVSEQASQQMIDILLGQEFNESIPALLPNYVKVAHKTGWNGMCIMTPASYTCRPEPYVLSIMTRGFSEARKMTPTPAWQDLRRIYEKFFEGEKSSCSGKGFTAASC